MAGTKPRPILIRRTYPCGPRDPALRGCSERGLSCLPSAGALWSTGCESARISRLYEGGIRPDQHLPAHRTGNPILPWKQISKPGVSVAPEEITTRKSELTASQHRRSLVESNKLVSLSTCVRFGIMRQFPVAITRIKHDRRTYHSGRPYRTAQPIKRERAARQPRRAALKQIALPAKSPELSHRVVVR